MTSLRSSLRVLAVAWLFGLAEVNLAAPTIADDAAPARIEIAADHPVGAIRALHGVNGGPLNQGETVDLTADWKLAGIPLARLHDCEWPGGDLVDMHAVFPRADADPSLPASYRFARTDDYLAAVERSGAKIVYRLGENIEHTKRKHHVMPPADYDRWAEACLGIIRHYNEGWADGSRLGIAYWEIWNEPENRPAMWSGSDEDYYRLYVTAARAIKRQFPQLKVGGPAVGASGEVVDGQWRPTPFLSGFLAACREHEVPLDFFSWHTYSDDPRAYRVRAKGIRRWLDEHQFQSTEIHLNEWNYLPGNDWSPLLAAGQGGQREMWYDAMGGAAGAAFVAAVLVDLQDCPIDAANYFTGDSSPFGLFSKHGAPKKTFRAMQAFQRLVETPRRIKTTASDSPDLFCAAGLNADGSLLTLLVSNWSEKERTVELDLHGLDWPRAEPPEALLIDASHDLAPVDLHRANSASWQWTANLHGQSVLVVRWRRP